MDTFYFIISVGITLAYFSLAMYRLNRAAERYEQLTKDLTRTRFLAILAVKRASRGGSSANQTPSKQ